jgi:hypothetical protein
MLGLLYYQGPDRWTNNAQRAYEFKFVDMAIQHAESMELKEVELALAFDNPHHVTTVPLAEVALRHAA